jgi:hypothetical protein
MDEEFKRAVFLGPSAYRLHLEAGRYDAALQAFAAQLAEYPTDVGTKEMALTRFKGLIDSVRS